MQLLKNQFPNLAPLDHDDIIQMVFSRLAQSGLRNFHGSNRNTFLAYFGVIVTNEARSFLAAEKMRRSVILPERDTDEMAMTSRLTRFPTTAGDRTKRWNEGNCCT